MKKSKSKDIDLFYISDEEKKKNRKVAGKSKPATKKKKNEQNKDEDIFCFDDEVVIGITKIEDKHTKNKKTKKDNKQTNTNSKAKKQIKSKKTDKKINSSKQKKNNKQSKKMKIAKYTFLFALLIGAIVYFMLSPVFNIKRITVSNNEKITNEEIISLSRITIGENIFKIRLGDIEKSVNESPYIDSVTAKRKLPNEIQIEVIERNATYMLEFVNSMVYINNQGYILEITEEKIDVPIIVGYETQAEELKAGGRLCIEDLKKLETVLKIVETTKNYEIYDLITKIGIADKNNFTLYLEGEKKTVYLGDASNINTRIMYLKKIIELEKGIESEVFINGDINKDDVYTREKV